MTMGQRSRPTPPTPPFSQPCGRRRKHKATISQKSLYIVNSYSRYTRALTFQNFYISTGNDVRDLSAHRFLSCVRQGLRSRKVPALSAWITLQVCVCVCARARACVCERERERENAERVDHAAGMYLVHKHTHTHAHTHTHTHG